MKLFSFGFVAVGFAGVAQGVFDSSAFEALSAPAAQVVYGAMFLALASSLKKKSATAGVSSNVDARRGFRISASEAGSVAG